MGRQYGALHLPLTADLAQNGALRPRNALEIDSGAGRVMKMISIEYDPTMHPSDTGRSYVGHGEMPIANRQVSSTSIKLIHERTSAPFYNGSKAQGASS